jgi:putative phosphoesterase
MKIMFASDIHGSAYYAERMRKAYELSGAKKLILLGDLLYHGPRNDLPKEYSPKKVIEILNSMKNEILCVRGNCDTEVDQMVLDFPIMADYALLVLEDKTLYLTHGHIYNPINPPKLKKGDILMNGHTHIRAMEEYDEFTYINPGSVSIPKDNKGNSCMLYDNGIFKFIDL